MSSLHHVVLTVLALVCTPTGATRPLGPLLLHPEERQDLARARAQENGPLKGASNRGGVVPRPGTNSDASHAGPQGRLTLDGWVLRRDGRSTAWVNGEPVYRFDRDGAGRRTLRDLGLLSRSPSSPMPGRLALRPGETLMEAGAAPHDLLPEGAVSVKRIWGHGQK